MDTETKLCPEIVNRHNMLEEIKYIIKSIKAIWKAIEKARWERKGYSWQTIKLEYFFPLQKQICYSEWCKHCLMISDLQNLSRESAYLILLTEQR